MHTHTHTPGPWIARKGVDGEKDRWGVNVHGPLEWSVATIENGAPGDTLETEGHNAYLIAAAPELLAALVFLLNETEDYIKINHLTAHHNHGLQLARRAIAKAEGRP